MSYHEPVLLAEVLRFLEGKRRILDATLGGGGHSEALLRTGARVTAVDRDPAARQTASARLADYINKGALSVVDTTFADALEGELAAELFDGALFDLGVSSHQLDDEARGFTFRPGAGLDMRMGAGALGGGGAGGAGALGRGGAGGAGALGRWGAGGSAADWLNSSTAAELEGSFRAYADEPRARRLASVIIKRRANREFSTSDDLVGAIREVLGPRSGPSDFARIFQAVRISVNDEIGELERALSAVRDRLEAAGVLVVISYHSVEDRTVKRTFQEWSRACVCPPRQPMCTCGGVAAGETLTRKPVVATDDEIARNPRARSARLRAWRKGQ